MRSTLLRATTLAALSTIALSACSDLTNPTDLSTVRTAPVHNAVRERVSVKVTALVDSLFYKGPANALFARLATAQREKVGSSEVARKNVVNFITWVRGQIGFIRPPAGETKEHAMDRLVLLLLTQIYEGPDADAPLVSAETDIGSGLIQPSATQPDTVQTKADQAAVVFPAGAVSEPTIVIITSNDSEYTANCSGPLPTVRCQYPLFYKYNVFPDKKLNAPATVAVCHVNSGPARLPLADHDRFRLAHQKPTDPSAYVEGGTVEGDIEILPLTDVGPLVTCNEIDYISRTASTAPQGVFASVVRGARERLVAAGSAIGAMLTPRDLHAIDRGGGGSVLFFSDFNTVDPQSTPDLRPSAAPSVSATTVVRGQSITVSGAYLTSAGTATAASSTPALVLAQDASLTNGVQLSVNYAAVAPLVPFDSVPLASVTVQIPESTAPGTYYIGVKADASNAIAEFDETNNAASVQIMVRDPFTLLCAEGAGSYQTLAEAVANTQPGGTIYVCPGEYPVESVLIDKPLTIEAQPNTTPKPVFRTVTALEGILLRHATGTVNVRRIAFRNDFADQTNAAGQQVFSYSIRANTAFANITVEDADFMMLTGGHASGLLAANGGVAGNSALNITRSTFTGGRTAVAATGNPANQALLPPSSLLITNSRIERQRAANPTAGNFALGIFNISDATITENVIVDCGERCLNITGANWRVANNEFSLCGVFNCVQTGGVGTTGVVSGNRMSNRVTGEYDPFFHHVLIATNSAQVTVENNEIDGCGAGQCITAILRATGTIRNNRIRAYYGDGTRIGVVLSDNSGGNAPETDRGASFTLADNIFEGVGGNAATQPDNGNSYPYSFAAVQAEGYSTMVAERNTISAANTALSVRTGSRLTGTRNVVNGVRAGVRSFDALTVADLNYNDVTGYRRAFEQGGSTGNDLTCNWWGSANGPTNFSATQGGSLYTPWATQPVAATGGGACDGTADPQYNITRIGTADGKSWANARAINAAGRVVGMGGNAFADWQGWVWQQNTTAVPSILPNPCGDWYSANDINDNNVIAMGSAYCALLVEQGADPFTSTVVGVPAPPPSNRSGAYAVNNNGQVLACTDNGSFAYNYIWDRRSNEMTTLPQQYANYCNGDINRDGLAVISSGDGGVLLWNQTNRTSMPLPSSIAGYRHFGMAISDAGVVVGRACTDAGACRAWRWVAGMTAVQDLGTLGGASAAALGVNSAGFIVGWAETAAGQRHAFVWSPDTQRMTDLGVLEGTTESVANAINDSGVIVGSAGVVQTNSQAVRWTQNP